MLVVRVHDLAPKQVWSKRYDQINAFEKLLVDNSTIVLKFFLHISKDEQEVRLLEREENPLKSWKLSVGDWQERTYWDKYQKAYEDALEKCSTAYAPWNIIPADQKWFRNLAISEIVVTSSARTPRLASQTRTPRARPSGRPWSKPAQTTQSRNHYAIKAADPNSR